MFLKRSMFAAVLPLLLLSILLVACGNNATTVGAPTSATATVAPTATPAALVVMTANATIAGKSVTILTNAKGMTLYYFTPDTATTSSCTSANGCLANWPALLYTGTGLPAAPATLPGILGTISCANGNQVQYQGHFLYTFAGDTKPGDINGQGKNGVWFAATTDLTLLTSPNTGNGYGY